MRHLIHTPNESVLTWLFERDAEPSVLPTFPTDSSKGLVVSQLLNGSCYAEVVTTPDQLKIACGPGLPLGRLFFHIGKDELYAVCDSLDAAKFGGRL
jgi:hypothetical protein